MTFILIMSSVTMVLAVHHVNRMNKKGVILWLGLTIIGGLIFGSGEKIADVYWGEAMGGAIEDWFAYVVALIFLLFRPQGLFGEKIIERV